MYHFGYLLPNGYKSVSDSSDSAGSTTIHNSAGIVAGKGYSGLFNVVLIDFIFIKFTL